MIKSILIYSLVFFILYAVGYNLHLIILQKNEIYLPFSLQKIYLFHLGFSMLICINFRLFSSVDKIFQQLGFIYLATLVLKIILFTAIFYKSIFTEENMAFSVRISLLIPAIIFLLTEAFFIARILTKKQ
ncbi:MAG: DUF6168 family protein [Polaribacter sp.]|uniref:DUF6168 family protein n=1 Tax=Polaribacter sp. TaxID=1920175 RepID=UPI003BB1E9A5